MRVGHSLQDLIFGTSNYQSQIKQLYAQGHQLGSCFFAHPSISNQRFLVLSFPYLGPLELSHCIYPLHSLELDFLLMLPPFVALIGRNQRPNVFIPYRNFRLILLTQWTIHFRMRVECKRCISVA